MNALAERLRHLPTTGAGLGAGIVVIAVLKSWHCELPSDWLTWGLGFLASLPGLLGK